MNNVAAGVLGPGILFGHRPFLLYSCARGCSELAYLIATVAIGWQVYSLSHSAFDLGVVGLLQFIPTMMLTLIAGHVADCYERRRVAQMCQAGAAMISALLAWGCFAGRLRLPEMFAAAAALGTVIALEGPAAAALLPAVTPPHLRQQGTALATGAFHVAAISGPALGGAAYAISPGAAYSLMAILWFMAGAFNAAIRLAAIEKTTQSSTLSNVLAGARFVRQSPAILGTISLDLFAVLFGGATALLPIYADSILHTGPWGLGLLRSAPAIGALLMTAHLAYRPIQRRAGLRMFQAVIVFGLTTSVFAISHLLWLSIGTLVILGAADTVSMVIRSALVQLGTPDEMQGRVAAVNSLFINTSYQLGEFESGMAAALLGVVPAVALGGVGTVLVTLMWMKLFPTLRHVERLE